MKKLLSIILVAHISLAQASPTISSTDTVRGNIPAPIEPNNLITSATDTPPAWPAVTAVISGVLGAGAAMYLCWESAFPKLSDSIPYASFPTAASMARQHANNAKRLAEAAVSTGDVIVKVKQSVWPAIAMFFSGIGLSVSVPTLATQESGATLSILGDRHAGAPQSVIAKLESNDEEPVRYRWSLTQNGVSKGSMISNSSTIEFPLENSADFGIAVISSTLSNNVAIRGIAAQFRLEDNLPRADFTYTTEEEYAPASIWADALFDSSQAASCTWVINNEEQDCELSDAPQNLILNKPGLNNVMLKITGHNGAVNLSAAQEIHVKNPSPEVNISDCKFELNNDDFMTAECLGSANPVFPESTIQKTEWLVDGQKTLENIDDFKYTWASPKISELTLRATDNLGHVGEQKVLLYIINPGAYAEY